MTDEEPKTLMNGTYFRDAVMMVFPKANWRKILTEQAFPDEERVAWTVDLSPKVIGPFFVYWGANMGWSVHYGPTRETLRAAEIEFRAELRREIEEKRKILEANRRMTRGL